MTTTTEQQPERAPTEDERRGIAWWNGLDEQSRRRWLDQVGTGRVADAWAACKRAGTAQT